MAQRELVFKGLIIIKNVIPIFIIIVILGISIYSVVSGGNANVNTSEVETLEEEIPFGDNIRVPDDTRKLSNYRVENIESVLKFIDPHEMQNYDDLLTLYSSYLPLCINESPKVFFETNKFNIRELLGIYSEEKYLSFYEFITSNGVTKDSVVDYIEVVYIEKANSLLKSNVIIHFNNTSILITHYLDYLYIEQEAYLFLYASSGGINE